MGHRDDIITLERLSYTLSGSTITHITQQQGVVDTDPALLETELAFQVGGEDITTETIADHVTTHRFDRGLYAGPEDPAGNYGFQIPNGQFRSTMQVDANENHTWLTWDEDGKHLEKVADAIGAETLFDYNPDDTLNYSLDAEGRKTQYAYTDSNNPRQPTEIKIYDIDGTTLLHWQTFSYDPAKGHVLTERMLDPADGTGNTILQAVARVYYADNDPTIGARGLLQKVTQIDNVNDPYTKYTYDEAGRVTQTKQGSFAGDCCFTLTEYDDAGNVRQVTEVRDPLQASDPEKSPVTTHIYDTLGRRVRTTTHVGTTFDQMSLTIYDALDRVSRTITNYDNTPGYTAPAGWQWDAGLQAWVDQSIPAKIIDHGTNNDLNLIADTAYNDRGFVQQQRDVLGHETFFVYDVAGRLVRTIANYIEQGSPATDPGDWVWSDSNNQWERGIADSTPIDHGSSADQNLITESVYDAVGNLVQAIDMSRMVTFTVYDALNRPVKVVRAAKDAATIALDPGDIDYEEADDPRSDDYLPSSDPDRDLIATTEYDTLGRVQETVDVLGRVTRIVYDSLGRQVRTIVNYVAQGSPATDPADWVWSDSNTQWEHSASDPTPIAHGAANDENLITQTIYDDHGRTFYTQDELAVRTWFDYDGLGRGVQTIASAKPAASPLSPGDPGYLAANDPRSPSYVPSSAADEDLITTTTYDNDGRVQQTTDVLGNVTYLVYDSLGRQVRTITNYLEQGSPATDPAAWVWSDSNNQWERGESDPTAIVHGADNDQNILAETVYGDQGRVSSTFDHRHNETQYTYDALGRRVKTITNYENSEFSVSEPDEDVTTTTTYDVAGRVIETKDNADVKSRFSYDRLGRQVKTVVNYTAATDPADWVWMNGRWEDGSNIAIDHGVGHDQNLVSQTVYNIADQVAATRDSRGTQTAFAYDAAGRRVTVAQAADTSLEMISYTAYDKAGRVLRTLQNWSNDPNKPLPDAQDGSGNWLFVPAHHGLQDDTDLITEFTYDAVGDGWP